MNSPVGSNRAANSGSRQRITGLETEYGCLVSPPLQVSEVISQVRDWIYARRRYGMIDQHDRDWDEPAGNGGFLFNGGRLYLDMGHLEYCTAECASTQDVVRYDRAGDLLLNEAVEALGLTGQVTFIRNNIDHYTGATFGCHENYSLLRNAPLSQKNVLSLLAFLTLRAVYAGAGRVGASHGNRLRVGTPAREASGTFQISQRADYIQNDFFEWVQHNRAIINTRDEPLADPSRYRRLHLIHGDTNVLPSALYLKVGSTRLVFDLLEEDDLPAVALQDAVATLRQLSRTLTPPWTVRLADGQTADALEVLAQFHHRAARRFRGRDEETDCILALWKRALEGLASCKTDLIGLLDWPTKEHLFSAFCESEKISWDHPWLEAQDLEYHSIDPERSVAHAVAQGGGGWCVEDQGSAMRQPPQSTRARVRSELMKEIPEDGSSYILDWDSVQVDEQERYYLLDPFQTDLQQPAER